MGREGEERTGGFREHLEDHQNRVREAGDLENKGLQEEHRQVHGVTAGHAAEGDRVLAVV